MYVCMEEKLGVRYLVNQGEVLDHVELHSLRQGSSIVIFKGPQKLRLNYSSMNSVCM